jgi:hypothetical protein
VPLVGLKLKVTIGTAQDANHGIVIPTKELKSYKAPTPLERLSINSVNSKVKLKNSP